MGRLLDLRNLPLVEPLPEEYWPDSGAMKRSTLVTALYAWRYAGPRDRRVLGHHPFWELIVTFRGEGMLCLRGEVAIPLRPGVAVLLPPMTDHFELSSGSLDTLWLGLQGARLQALPKTVSATRGDELPVLAEQLWLRAQRAGVRVGPELDGQAWTLLAAVLRLQEERQRGGDSLVDSAIDHLHRHFAEPLSIARLAARLGCSEGHLFRAFKRRTGQTPHAFITRLRIERAVSLLRQSSLSIGRISRLCGYRDPLHFSRVFRSLRGRPPSKEAQLGG